VLVGVSGGADSVALLRCLHELRHELAIEVRSAHYNHRLRPEAGEEEAFVRRLSRSLGIPCDVGRWDHRTTGRVSEDLARRKRLAFLTKLAREHKAVLALAHTENDMAETVLMRLLRGTGLQGISAIWPERLMDGVRVTRPFLTITRREIETYLRERDQPYRTDPSNRDTTFFRNKVRLELLPLLKEQYAPTIEKTLARLARTSLDDYTYLRDQAGEAIKRLGVRFSGEVVELPLDDVRRWPVALWRMAIRQVWEYLSEKATGEGHLTMAHVADVEALARRKGVGAIVDLPKGVKAQRTAATCLFWVAKKNRRKSMLNKE